MNLRSLPNRYLLFTLLTLSVLLACSKSSLAESMTLEAALAAAYLSNPQLEAQRAQLRGTDGEVAKALAGWRPTLGLSGSYGWQKQRQTLLGAQSTTSAPESEQITLSQPLFDGRTIPSTAYAKALVDAGREQLRATEQTILLSTANAYFSVLRDIEIVAAYHEDIDRLRAISANTQDRLRIGDLTRTDASQAAARLLGSQINIAAAERQLASSRAAFEHLVGRPAEMLVEHEHPRLPDDLEEALQIALAKNPNLAQRRAELRAADHNVSVATGALLPSLSVSTQYGRSVDTIAPGIRQNGVSVLGQLTIPIYQGGAEHAAIRQAKQQTSRAIFASHDTERQVREDLVNAWESLRLARAASDLSARQVEANADAYQGATMESRVGSRNIIDILNADQELLQSRITAIAQRQNSVVAGYQVLSVMGGMTAQYLKLPVQLYDPVKHYNENATRWFGLGE